MTGLPPVSARASAAARGETVFDIAVEIDLFAAGDLEARRGADRAGVQPSRAEAKEVPDGRHGCNNSRREREFLYSHAGKEPQRVADLVQRYVIEIYLVRVYPVALVEVECKGGVEPDGGRRAERRFGARVGRRRQSAERPQYGCGGGHGGGRAKISRHHAGQ